MENNGKFGHTNLLYFWKIYAIIILVRQKYQRRYISKQGFPKALSTPKLSYTFHHRG